MAIMERLRQGWNAFMNRDPTRGYRDYGPSYGSRPDRIRLYRRNERSIVSSIYNRMSLDVALLTFQHCRLDENDRYKGALNSSLNERLNLEANLDQTGRAFIQDAVLSMFDEGCVALCPIDTDTDVDISNNFIIDTMRVGRIVDWYPSYVKVNVYNERTGQKEDLVFPKLSVAIIENPFYAVMNEPNSTIQRLIRKLSLLDVTDEHTASGKLDMIIQLPYTVKSPTKREWADARRKDLETQLEGSKYGIGYIDSTEKITQLNRPIENNLLKQIEYLTNLAFSQLGITQGILDGTADDKTMLNYYSRTIEPVALAIVEEMRRKFLTKTARTQRQTIMFFRDPFRLVPVNDVAEIADKFTRNEIMTSNEIRQIVGMKPSDDPKADQLVNSNISQPENARPQPTEDPKKEDDNQNGY